MRKKAGDLARANLHEIFGERDTRKRQEKLAELWVPSVDAIFLEGGGVFLGFDAISDMIEDLLNKAPGFIFKELSGSP
jgi:hypothetical protein